MVFEKLVLPLQGECRTGFRFCIRLGALAHFPSVGSDNPPSPPHLGMENVKIWEKLEKNQGPIGNLYDNFTTLQGPLNIQNRRVR